MGLFFNFRDPRKALGDLGKYAEDYRITETPDEKGGRPRRQVIYTGSWYLPRERCTVRLWLCAAMAVMLAALHIRLLLLTHAGSSQLYVMLPLLAGLFPVLYLLMGVFSLPLRGKPMRRDQYMHSFIRASRASVAVAVCSLLGQLGTLLYRTLAGDWLFLPEDWLFLLLGLAVLLLFAGILLTLRSIEIAERENAAFPATIQL